MSKYMHLAQLIVDCYKYAIHGYVFYKEQRLVAASCDRV